MKVLIIEDEAPAFRRLQKVLEEIDPEIEIVEVMDSVKDTERWIRNHKLPDLIFMDIQLSDGLSFEIFDLVPINTPVIFTTAFDEYVLKAFKVNSIDYLLKPIKKEDVEKSLQKYRILKSEFSNQIDIGSLMKEIQLEKKNYKNRFLVKIGDKMISIPTESISYLQTRRGVVHLITHENKTYLLDQNLEEIMTSLDPQLFFRANRQFIVHFKSIMEVEKYHKGKLFIRVTPEPDESVIVSAEKAGAFKSWLDR